MLKRKRSLRQLFQPLCRCRQCRAVHACGALFPGSQQDVHAQVFWHTTLQGVAMQLAREAGAQICDDALALGITHVIAEVQ